VLKWMGWGRELRGAALACRIMSAPGKRRHSGTPSARARASRGGGSTKASGALSRSSRMRRLMLSTAGSRPRTLWIEPRSWIVAAIARTKASMSSGSDGRGAAQKPSRSF